MDPHALYAGGVQPARGEGGAGTDRGGRQKRGGKFKSQQKQQEQQRPEQLQQHTQQPQQKQQQQWQPRQQHQHGCGRGGAAVVVSQWRWNSKARRWTWYTSVFMSFGTGGQIPVPPMSQVPTDPPPETIPPMPPSSMGWGPPPRGTPGEAALFPAQPTR